MYNTFSVEHDYLFVFHSIILLILTFFKQSILLAYCLNIQFKLQFANMIQYYPYKCIIILLITAES